MFLRLQSYEAISAVFWQSASYVFNNRYQLLNGYYLGAPNFLQFKEFNCIWALSFFKDMFTHFHDF